MTKTYSTAHTEGWHVISMIQTGYHILELTTFLIVKLTQKKQRISRNYVLDWKIQLEKVQLTRDLKDDTIIYQGIRLSSKRYQGYCNPTTRTQATIVWFPENTCTTFQIAKIHARMIKFHQNYFIESILWRSKLWKNQTKHPTF